MKNVYIFIISMPLQNKRNYLLAFYLSGIIAFFTLTLQYYNDNGDLVYLREHRSVCLFQSSLIRDASECPERRQMKKTKERERERETDRGRDVTKDTAKRRKGDRG